MTLRPLPVAISLAVLGLLAGAGLAWQRMFPPPTHSARLGAFDPADPDLGRKAYVMCLSCHGSAGRGIPGYAPPLAGSPWLTGNPATAVLISLHGFDATHEPDSAYTSSRMAGHAHQLTDAELAALLTWTRRQWGNAAAAIDAALVGRLRQRFAGRTLPWTPAELRTWAENP